MPQPRRQPKPAEFVSVADVADRTGWSREHVRNLIYGTRRAPAVLPHLRSGRTIRIPLAAIDAYLLAETRLGVG